MWVNGIVVCKICRFVEAILQMQYSKERLPEFKEK
jgi:hypothetical protein